MNHHIVDRKTRVSAIAEWRRLCASGLPLDAADHLLYAILRESDPMSAFSPVTNATKIENGMAKWRGLEQAAWEVGFRIRRHWWKRRKPSASMTSAAVQEPAVEFALGCFVVSEDVGNRVVEAAEALQKLARASS